MSSGSPTITITNGQTTINAVISGTSGFTKTGAGALLLTATNTFTGTVINTSSDSRLAFTTPAAFAGQTIQLGATVGGAQTRLIASGADLTLTNNIEIRTIRAIIGSDTVGGLAASNQTWTGNVLLNQAAGSARDFFCQKELTISGTVSGGPTGLNLSSGKPTLQGSNTFTNNVNLTGGTLNINSDAALGAAANVITFNDASAPLKVPASTTVTLDAARSNICNSAMAARYEVGPASTLTVPGVVQCFASTNSNIAVG